MINHKGKNIVFLLSMPRSGSTLLSLMLGSHPAICCPPEPWIVLAVAEYLELGKVRNVPYDRTCAEIAAIEFLLNPERKQRGALGKALRGIVKRFRLGNITVARKILQAAYQLHLDVSGKSVFVDKTPRYYTVLELIDDIFPQSKKIVLLRNPLDIFASYKTTWKIQRTIFTPEGVAVHTRDFCEGLFTLADYIATSKDDVLVLRYEDLAIDPMSALQSVCAFEGIDFSHTMLTYYENKALIEEYSRSPVGDPVTSSQPKPTNNRMVNAWEKRLEGADIQALISVLGISIFERLGYGDTVVRLRDMSVDILTEEQAFECRNLLMRALVDRVHEQPFSVWNNFVLPLKKCKAAKAAQSDLMSEQAAAIEAVEKERNRLAIREKELLAENEHYVQVISEQQSYIRLLQSEIERLNKTR